MSFLTPFTHLYHASHALLFPHLCTGCGEELSDHDRIGVCKKCILSERDRTYFERNPYDNPILDSLGKKIPLRSAFSAWFFRPHAPIRHNIHALKYEGARSVAKAFAMPITQILRAHNHPLCQADYLVPMPLHTSRLRSRGYNQSALIAEALSAQLHIPMAEDILVRVKKTRAQAASESAGERMKNMRGAFALNPKTNLSMYEKKHIALIDDVLTTGATMYYALDMLYGIRGVELSILCMATTMGLPAKA